MNVLCSRTCVLRSGRPVAARASPPTNEAPMPWHFLFRLFFSSSRKPMCRAHVEKGASPLLAFDRLRLRHRQNGDPAIPHEATNVVPSNRPFSQSSGPDSNSWRLAAPSAFKHWMRPVIAGVSAADDCSPAFNLSLVRDLAVAESLESRILGQQQRHSTTK